MEVFGKFCQAAAAEDPAASLLQEAAQVTRWKSWKSASFFYWKMGCFLEILWKCWKKSLEKI